MDWEARGGREKGGGEAAQKKKVEKLAKKNLQKMSLVRETGRAAGGVFFGV